MPFRDARDLVALAAFLLAVGTFFWNTYTFHRNTNLTLFKERFAIYSSLIKLKAAFDLYFSVPEDQITECLHATQHVDFLFGPEVGAHTNTIIMQCKRLNLELKTLEFYQNAAAQPEGGNAPSFLKSIKDQEDLVRASRVRLKILTQNETNPVFWPYMGQFNLDYAQCLTRHRPAEA